MIGSNFLKISGWAVVVKYATSVVYVGTHFFPQFLESSRSHSNEYNNVISSEKHAPKKWERDWWFYGISVWYYWWPSSVSVVLSAEEKKGKVKIKSKDFWNFQSVTEHWGF